MSRFTLISVLAGMLAFVAAMHAQPLSLVKAPVATITDVTPKIVSAGAEVTVLIKAPSPASKLTLSIFAVDPSPFGRVVGDTLATEKMLANGAIAHDIRTVSDDDDNDLEKQPGVIMVKVKTNASWAPAPGAALLRRYTLMLTEASAEGVVARLEPLRHVSVKLGTELAQAIDALEFNLARLTASTGQLKDLHEQPEHWALWTSLLQNLARKCAKTCVAEYNGIVVSRSFKKMSDIEASAQAIETFRSVASGLSAEALATREFVAALPADDQQKYRDALASLNAQIDQLKVAAKPFE